MTYENEIVRAVQKVLPTVVSIAITKNIELIEKKLPFGGQTGKPAADMLPKDDEGNVKLGGGSGFIISEDGLVLTNKHVIMDTEAHHTVIDQDGNRYPGVEILARDPIHDVAILKIKPLKKLPRAPLGNSRKLVLGQSVIAIGNALGEFQSTVSTGVVSGLSRLITAITDMTGHQERLRGLIQTDAAINPGNSGGPLINIKGEVIGINAAVVFGAQNIGFAIPINKARRDIDDIQEYGKIRRPFLGVRYMLLNPAIQKRFGLDADHGALVVREPIPGDHAVVPGSAAHKGGIKESDIILDCNGKNITEKETLEDLLENTKPGDAVMLTVLRNKKPITKKIKLSEWV